MSSPINYLNLFIDDHMYDEMALETNRYANQCLQDRELPPKSCFRRWTPTCRMEIKAFLGLILAMGLVSLLSIRDYWSMDAVTATPFFPATMARDRFLLLLSFFHLNNNQNFIRRGFPGHDPLYKLGIIFKTIVSRFSSVYYPSKNLSLDEGMVPWRGNLHFRVYNPDKPTKYGIKTYMLCDSENGYCSKLQIYTGKNNSPPSAFGITYDLVMFMLHGYFGRGHVIYMDSYYSSPRLFFYLWQLGVGATGTVRKNRRGVPQYIKDIVVSRGCVAVANNGPLIIVKYNDSKMVLLLSTVQTSGMTETGKINRKTKEPEKRPALVCAYNRYMGGVDRSDQMISYGRVLINSMKWWKKVFFHVFSMAVLNAFKLYQANTPEEHPLLHREFRSKLVTQLVAEFAAQRVPVGRPPSSPLQRLTGRHFLTKLQGDGVKKNLARVCAVCGPAERELLVAGQKRKRCGRETTWQCESCKVSLCVWPCFKFYHSKQDYILAYRRWKSEE